MSQVHAPYHFVPLSKWIYMPDWAHLVSHDVPFKDGMSGVIDYTLTNATPLCVGGQQEQQPGQPSLVKWAKDPKGNPVIPGSSLQGMIRNVLEIASFGKFSGIDDNHFSFREVPPSKGSTYSKLLDDHKTQAGWLKYNNDTEEWEFTESDFCKLSYKEVNQALGSNIENSSKAIEKYEKIPLKNEFMADISEPRGKQKNRWADSFNEGSTKGHCVFTNERVGGDSEYYQFGYFFYNKKTVVHTHISEAVKNLFANHRSIDASTEVKGEKLDQVEYLKKHGHPEFGIPVFALVDKKQNKIHSMGLTKIVRASYENSIKNLVTEHTKNHASSAYFDMAELMFGTDREKGLALRGRISFSDATYLGNVNNLYESSRVTLLSPKPTFLGGYIKQETSEKYNDYTTQGSVVSGWKRYGIKEFKESHGDGSDNVDSKLELLPENSRFQGKLVFHNLKKEELSALIWALTLGNSRFNYHSLGHGKPLGAGAVKFTINEEDLSIQSNSGYFEGTVSDISKGFEIHMNSVHYKKDGWVNSTQVKHLRAITDINISDYNNLNYMTLNDYGEVKKNKLSITLNDIDNNVMNNNEESYIRKGSPTFGKGRLSALVDNTNDWDMKEAQLQREVIELQQVAEKKSNLKLEEDKIKNSTLSPYEKLKGLLEIIKDSQDGYSKTDKKNKTKDLRDIFKELKNIELLSGHITVLLDIYENINISQKDTEKAIKYLKAVAK